MRISTERKYKKEPKEILKNIKTEVKVCYRGAAADLNRERGEKIASLKVKHLKLLSLRNREKKRKKKANRA